MARDKATITLDRSKLESVKAITGATSVSQAIDLALTEMIRNERIRRDVEAYTANPPTDEELALATGTFSNYADLEDDTDWGALYDDGRS